MKGSASSKIGDRLRFFLREFDKKDKYKLATDLADLVHEDVVDAESAREWAEAHLGDELTERDNFKLQTLLELGYELREIDEPEEEEEEEEEEG